LRGSAVVGVLLRGVLAAVRLRRRSRDSDLGEQGYLLNLFVLQKLEVFLLEILYRAALLSCTTARTSTRFVVT
jgi:hypothetical protein